MNMLKHDGVSLGVRPTIDTKMGAYTSCTENMDELTLKPLLCAW